MVTCTAGPCTDGVREQVQGICRTFSPSTAAMAAARP
jgi:hypothetical protein